MLSLSLGGDPAPQAAPHAPVVVSTGAGCVGCGPTGYGPVVSHAAPCPCGGQHPTLVDWMKSKTNGSGRPGLFSRFRRADKPAAAVAHHNPCCDPCAGAVHLPGTVVPHHGAVVPPANGGGIPPGTAIPKDMPKPKDPTGTDPKTVPGKDTAPKPSDPSTVPGKDTAPKPGNGAVPKDLPKNPPSVSIPPLPPPVTGASGTNSPY
jgi:hypothetical protein